jgi:hypothetical protein
MPENAISLCDLLCNSHTPSTEAKSDILAVERHTHFQVRNVSKESRADVAFRRILSRFPKLLFPQLHASQTFAQRESCKAGSPRMKYRLERDPMFWWLGSNGSSS